jgi:low affinity Fe/Cu permease
LASDDCSEVGAMSQARAIGAKPGTSGVRANGKQDRLSALFSHIANYTAQFSGRPITFITASLIVIVWAITGPIFNFSDTWQLVINTGTTIVTFLMVFLIQNSQYRDAAAIQVKLDELIRASKVKNTFIGIEHLTDAEIDELRSRCEKRAQRSGSSVAPES